MISLFLNMILPPIKMTPSCLFAPNMMGTSVLYWPDRISCEGSRSRIRSLPATWITGEAPPKPRRPANLSSFYKPFKQENVIIFLFFFNLQKLYFVIFFLSKLKLFFKYFKCEIGFHEMVHVDIAKAVGELLIGIERAAGDLSDPA